MGYKIASFNLHVFGEKARVGNGERLINIANIIIKEKFDIVAFQEIFSEGKAVKDMFSRCFSSGHWDYVVSENNYINTKSEGYAFLWNKNRFKLVDDSVRTFIPHMINQYQDNELTVNQKEFSRVPYYARFIPVNGGFWELRLLNLHLHFGSDNKDDIKKRQKEYNILVKEVFPGINKLRKYGNNRPAITIFLGDYNLNIDKAIIRDNLDNSYNKNAVIEENPIIIKSFWDKQEIETIQYELTSLKNCSAEDGNGYANNYDHFTIDISDFKSKGVQYKCKRIDAVRNYYGHNNSNAFKIYNEKVSDHVPIVFEFNFERTANNFMKEDKINGK